MSTKLPAEAAKTSNPLTAVLTDVLDKNSNALPVRNKWTESLPSDFATFKDTLATGKLLLPARYHEHYVDILENAVSQSEEMTRKSPAVAKERLEQLASIFAQLAPPMEQLSDTRLSPWLKAYNTLLSNLYRRFLDDETIKKRSLSKIKWPDLDPLGYFTKSSLSPFALAASAELPVSLIAKPINQAAFVPLWFVDAHEVGGHVLHTLVRDLETELSDAIAYRIQSELEKQEGKSAYIDVPSSGGFFRRKHKRMQIPVFFSSLLRSWSHELMADTAGILNLGPAYLLGLTSYLASGQINGNLANSGTYSNKERFGQHPIQSLRAEFNSRLLERLEFPNKAKWLAYSRKRINEVTSSSPTKTANANRTFWLDASGSIVLDVSTADLKQSMNIAVDAIFETRLACLENRSLPELLTWGEKDSLSQDRICQAFSDDDFQSAVLHLDCDWEARHVIAASWMALEKICSQAESESMLSSGIDRLNQRALELLRIRYEEQCLLCPVPTYSRTRRQDLDYFKRLVKKLQRISQ